MHLEKETYNEALVKLRHDLRQSESYKNEDIDLSKSNQNYSFNSWNPFQKFQDRINELYIYGKNGKNKNNINYMCSIVVQYPRDCPISSDHFFKLLNEIFVKRFGIENTISSVVHLDEKTQHMHFKWVCATKMDKPKKGYTEKLCAKEVVNREMLRTFHKDIEDDFLKYYGIKLSLRSKEPRKYINDIYEFKEMQTKNEELKEKYNHLVDLYNSALTKVVSIKDYLNYQKTKERNR
jgi:hypothetical protein